MNIVPTEIHAAALLLEAGDMANALALAQRGLAQAPCAEGFGIIAAIHSARGDRNEALAQFREGRARFADHVSLAVNFARLLRETPDGLEESLDILRDTVSRVPDASSPRLSLVETLRTAVGRLDEAECEAREYVRRHPADGTGHLSLALILFNTGRLFEAMMATDEALALGADEARIWELRANLHVALGDPAAAAECYCQVLRIAPQSDIHSRLLMAMQYCDSVSQTAIHEETLRWAAAHTAGLVPRSNWPKLDFDPHRTLAVGIVSADFRQSSTALLAMPLFEQWPADWTVTLYSNTERVDDWTMRFRRTSTRWVDIVGLDDEAAAARITDDAVDVLIDLNGHTLGGRLGMFARKPAPVQLAWLDYVGTTGLVTFDGIVADAGHLPDADQRWYVEPIRRVRHNLYRFSPPPGAPDVAPLPAGRAGMVTFGCFNSPYKLSDTILSVWADILRAAPSARLVLNAPAYRLADTTARFRALFARHGIDPGRVEMRPGAAGPADMLSAYADIDIGLDSFPYSGGLTTIEALYMGVPVVTMPGERFGARHASVHLRTVGLGDWIARDAQDYVEIAVRGAADLQGLAAVRSGLRAKVEGSALMDANALAEDFSRLVRALWQAACLRARHDQ